MVCLAAPLCVLSAWMGGFRATSVCCSPPRPGSPLAIGCLMSLATAGPDVPRPECLGLVQKGAHALAVGYVPPVSRRQTSPRAFPAVLSDPAVAAVVAVGSAAEVAVGVAAVTAVAPPSGR
jgi:hypothetical protein